MQLSITHLFVINSVVAAWLAILVSQPHVAIACCPLLFLAFAIVGLKHVRKVNFLSRLALQLSTAISIIALYFVSCGPVIAIDCATFRLGPSVFKLIYFPVFWAHSSEVLSEELEWYFLQWGWE